MMLNETIQGFFNASASALMFPRPLPDHHCDNTVPYYSAKAFQGGQTMIELMTLVASDIVP